MDTFRRCPAPAKLNLFLHVLGRRADGYHLLQSVFQLIDLADSIDFESRNDGRIVRGTAIAAVDENDDLTVRAARLLQEQTGSTLGVTITTHKSIPLGGGMGGGSSDAATTLLALNRMWGTGLDRSTLMRLGARLGADVPFFIYGQNAFVEGIGDVISAASPPASHFAVIHPGISVPTAAIFTDPELTRNTEAIKIADFSASALGVDGPGNRFAFGRNDLQAVAAKRFPEVTAALRWLNRFGPARMTGSGACVFCPFDSAAEAKAGIAGLPSGWAGWAVTSLPEHPLVDWAHG